MDRELVAYLDERFRETSRQIESLREELRGEFREQGQHTQGQIEVLRNELHEQGRHTQGQIEALRNEFHEQGRHTQIQMEALRDEFRLVAEGVMGVDEKLSDFRVSVEKEFREVRALISPAYSGLDHRIHNLEDWRERKERDPVEIIRERFGRKTGPES